MGQRIRSECEVSATRIENRSNMTSDSSACSCAAFPIVSMMARLLINASFATALLIGGTALGAPPAPALRREILDAARPAATARVGQAVKFKIDHLNVDTNWAVLVGELANANGGPLDWSKAPSCNLDLDKSLWIVLARADTRWRVAQIEVCSPEPPYWYIEYFDWPCGVYAGLSNGEHGLEQECRRQDKAMGSRRTTP